MKFKLDLNEKHAQVSYLNSTTTRLISGHPSDMANVRVYKQMKLCKASLLPVILSGSSGKDTTKAETKRQL